MERIQIAINASDPITAAGLARYIRSYPEMVLRDTLDEHTDLLVVAIEGINSGHLRTGCGGRR